MLKLTVVLMSFTFISLVKGQKTTNRSSRVPSNWYNTTSLLDSLKLHVHLDSLINDANMLYDKIELQEVNVSRQAFVFGYLGKKLIAQKEIKGDNKDLKLSLVKKDTLVIVDFTKTADKKRLAVVDLKEKKLLYNTLTSHGNGETTIRKDGKKKTDFTFSNPKELVPEYFSNSLGSNLSSLGFMVTAGASTPSNPCHKCKYSLDTPYHVCQLLIRGLETNINDSVSKNRDIIIHTTGSRSFENSASRYFLGITDSSYKVDTSECYCYKNGKRSSATYASAQFLAKSRFMGRSNGCLVLPEEEHIGIIKTIIGGCLIFCYSNVINETANYFENSEIIKQIISLPSCASNSMRLPVNTSAR